MHAREFDATSQDNTRPEHFIEAPRKALSQRLFACLMAVHKKDLSPVDAAYQSHRTIVEINPFRYRALSATRLTCSVAPILPVFKASLIPQPCAFLRVMRHGVPVTTPRPDMPERSKGKACAPRYIFSTFSGKWANRMIPRVRRLSAWIATNEVR